MKYDKETTDQLTQLYKDGTSVLNLALKYGVPERSIIAKLSSLGIYKRKEYRTKRGEIPVKKEEYIERLAILLDTTPDILESLEKANKNVLAMIEKALLATKESE